MADQKVQKALPIPLQVNLNDQVKNGVYANLVSITTTSNNEVMMDFIFRHPMDLNEKNQPVGNLVSRVIIPLNTAKEIKLILESQTGKANKVE